ncbi:unnamed protein product [Owenia fusiformis]|uniref:Uncharacterized protein n=1 Tax=Owenia fusiformis TaxID=6347 RepID=A0A8J1XR55_OWEFU|nr:unnamed protein product [Owenia fusiformis]
MLFKASIFVMIAFIHNVHSHGESDDHGGERCLEGPFHKTSPSPEGPDYNECFSWKNKSCCTAEFTQELRANKSVNIYNFHWDHCGPISQPCEQFIKDEECFYQCEPELIKYQHPDPDKKRMAHKVPICADYCNQWFDACMYDRTCVSNWQSDFHYIDEVYKCPNNTICRTYQDMYRDGRGLCNNMWGQSFYYEDKGYCMVMKFDPTTGNPNIRTGVNTGSCLKTLWHSSLAIVMAMLMEYIDRL